MHWATGRLRDAVSRDRSVRAKTGILAYSLTSVWQLRQYSTGRADFVADGYTRSRSNRQIDIDARSETNKTVSLTTCQSLILFSVAKNTLGYQTSHLHSSDY